MYESIVFCSACAMSFVRKFTFAISSPDDFLVHRGNTTMLNFHRWSTDVYEMWDEVTTVVDVSNALFTFQQTACAAYSISG